MYIVQKGQVRINFDVETVRSRNALSLLSENQNQEDTLQSNKELLVEKTEGSYFGEWTLLGEHIDNLSATAVGNVICAILTKEKFESVIGPLAKLSQDDYLMYVVIFSVIYLFFQIHKLKYPLKFCKKNLGVLFTKC